MSTKEAVHQAMLDKLIAERDRKIIALDEDWARKILAEEGIHHPPRKQVLAGLHRARAALATAPRELRQASRKWLKTREAALNKLLPVSVKKK